MNKTEIIQAIKEHNQLINAEKKNINVNTNIINDYNKKLDKYYNDLHGCTPVMMTALIYVIAVAGVIGILFAMLTTNIALIVFLTIFTIFSIKHLLLIKDERCIWLENKYNDIENSIKCHQHSIVQSQNIIHAENQYIEKELMMKVGNR